MSTASLRDATAADDTFIAEAFRSMWLDIGYAPEQLVPDALDRTRAFITHARASLDFYAVIAEVEGAPIGCAAAQRFDGLYPRVLTPQRRTLGYVWGVYVAAEHRRTGLGEALTQRCIDAMRTVGCHEVVLHAAPMGRNVYTKLGFQPSHEMRLKLD